MYPLRVNKTPSESERIDKIKSLIEQVYTDMPAAEVDELLKTTCDIAKATEVPTSAQSNDGTVWSEKDLLLITYGDSIRDDGSDTVPIEVLDNFLSVRALKALSGVHILPCFPYSSDDGFSVIDYKTIDPDLGDWSHVSKLGDNFDMMFDLVMNHISAHSEWFKQYKAGEAPGKDYFVEVDGDADVSSVVRPRSHDLRVPVETPDGTKHVWATFSDDQIDLNFENPDVLVEFLKIIALYLSKGATFMRLDAIGFLWKVLGTPSIHLPETHALVKLVREFSMMINSAIKIVTETNVPAKENMSYFGDGDEAHMVYNFSLAPLVLQALMTGDTSKLVGWMQETPSAPAGCTYFNFTASHDGIGLRPTEGILSDDERNQMLDAVKSFGGQVSMKANSDGTESPYEMNIALYDAMSGKIDGVPDEYQFERFICSQTVMLSVKGIPGMYVHSLLGTRNYTEGLAETGRARTINRRKWQVGELEALLDDPTSHHHKVFNELTRRMAIRRSQAAFSPDAAQKTLDCGEGIFAYYRAAADESQQIICINNFKDTEVEFDATGTCSSAGVTSSYGKDLITEADIDLAKVTLAPYQSVWVELS